MMELVDIQDLKSCAVKREGSSPSIRTFSLELWADLQEMDKKLFKKFRGDYSIDELSEKFTNEKL